MSQYLRSRWELLLGLLVFVAFKIPALRYPFYWDESWSYAPGVKLMYLHGPSLMPNAIDLFYSRGHPLLFYASAAAWMKIFGDSHIAQHTFCLLLSVSLIITSFEVCLRLFNRRTAVLCLLLLPLQLMFFVQTTFLLPEVMIGLFTLLALFFYVENKYIGLFICCSALLLTKESGIVMSLILGIHSFLSLFNRKEPFGPRIRNFGALVMAATVISAFFLVQKKMNGWYFYPEHTGYIQWIWPIFWDKFRFALFLLFNDNDRTWLFRFVMAMGVLAAIFARNIRYAIPLLPGILIYAIVEDRGSIMPRKMLFAVMLLSMGVTAWQLVRISINSAGKTRKFIYLNVLFLAAYLVFTCVNFFTARYLICMFPLLLIVTAAFLDAFINKIHRVAYYVALAAIAFTGLWAFKTDTGLGDIHLGAMDGMTVQQNVINYLEQGNLFDKNIAAASFQQQVHLSNPHSGFLHSPRVFKNVTGDVQAATDYIIVDNIEPDGNYEWVRKNQSFRLVYRTTKGAAWAEIYGRIK